MTSISESLLAATNALESAGRQIDDEIRGYPAPVAGCDAQYNHLLAERRRVRDALYALSAEVHVPTPRRP